MTDQAGGAAAHFQTDLRQLGRLARARFAADDHHLVVADGGGDICPAGRNRQVRVEGQFFRKVQYPRRLLCIAFGPPCTYTYEVSLGGELDSTGQVEVQVAYRGWSAGHAKSRPNINC